MNPANTIVGAGVFAVLSAVLAGNALLAMPAGERGRLEVPMHRVDLAVAPVAELALLPEVGAGLAARIAQDRATRGGFASIDDVSRVPGVGEAVLRSLRAHARVSTGRGRP